MDHWLHRLAVVVLAASAAAAQVHGIPASATSTVGRSSPNIPAGATSLGPLGFADTTPAFMPGKHRIPRDVPRDWGAVPFAYPVYVPVAVTDDGYTLPQRESRMVEVEPQAAPQRVEIVITDKRGNEPGEKPAAAPLPTPATTRSEKTEELPVTVLILRDGSRREVKNYAIMGRTLYDLAGERMFPIALDSLDLEATVRANEAAGRHFQLP